MNKNIYISLLFIIVGTIIIFIFCNDNPIAIKDTKCPIIVLVPLLDTVFVGDTWIEPGYSCLDETDGDLTKSVMISGVVNTSKICVCTLFYTVSDKAGNIGTANRIVNINASAGLFASYMFNADGQDNSGNDHHGIVSGAVSTSDRFGAANSAYSFDGINNYILVSSIKFFPKGNSPKTISGWFKSSAEPCVKLFFGIGSPADKGNFQVGSSTVNNSDDQFTVNGWGAANDWKTGIKTKPLFDGKWHHCAVTYDMKRTILYVDGEEVAATSSFIYNTNSDTGRIVIGMEIDLNGWAFKGDLDDIAIYTRALTSQQIKALCFVNNWKPDTTNDTSSIVVTGLNYTIEGISGNLSLLLKWNAVPNAFAYGIYYQEGQNITSNALYRIATTNSKLFTTELQEGNQYTFAVTIAYQNGTESNKSAPLTIMFNP